MPLACFQCVEHCWSHRNMPKACPYVMMKSKIYTAAHRVGEKERGARFAADTSHQLGKIDIYE